MQVGVHSSLANQLAHQLVSKRLLSNLPDYKSESLQKEVTVKAGWRVDMAAELHSGATMLVEVKSVTLSRDIQVCLLRMAATDG